MERVREIRQDKHKYRCCTRDIAIETILRIGTAYLR